MVTNKQKFNKKYGFESNAPHSKAEISKLTGIPKKYLDKVYDRGLGARRSNPQSVRSKSGKKIGGTSLKGKMTGPTWKTADKDIADEIRKLKIKGYMR